MQMNVVGVLLLLNTEQTILPLSNIHLCHAHVKKQIDYFTQEYAPAYFVWAVDMSVASLLYKGTFDKEVES